MQHLMHTRFQNSPQTSEDPNIIALERRLAIRFHEIAMNVAWARVRETGRDPHSKQHQDALAAIDLLLESRRSL